MGHKIHPYGLRLGVIKGWLSTWFAKSKKDYVKNLTEDIEIREFLRKRFAAAGVEKIEIIRTQKLEIIVYVARPGLAIGRGGALIEQTKKDLQKMLKQEAIELKIRDVKQINMSAALVAQQIARGIEKRRSVRSLVKRALEAIKKTGVKGAKIWVAGRLTGGEHANLYKKGFGRVPAHTLRADIDYAYERAETSNAGVLSVKVWIYKGDVY